MKRRNHCTQNTRESMRKYELTHAKLLAPFPRPQPFPPQSSLPPKPYRTVSRSLRGGTHAAAGGAHGHGADSAADEPSGVRPDGGGHHGVPLAGVCVCVRVCGSVVLSSYRRLFTPHTSECNPSTSRSACFTPFTISEKKIQVLVCVPLMRR